MILLVILVHHYSYDHYDNLTMIIFIATAITTDTTITIDIEWFVSTLTIAVM